MQVSGLIYDIDINNRIFSLKCGKNLKYFYCSNGLMRKFKKYLFEGILVSFVCEDICVNKNNVLVYQVNFFKEIDSVYKSFRVKHYSKPRISSELKDFVNTLDNLMFIDLEMSMPGYNNAPKDFLIELIQASYIITDKNFNAITKTNLHILPTINKFLTDRCMDFLNITYDELQFKAVPFKKFYNQFKKDIIKYNPTIIIFGKNDKLFLEKAYKTNNVSSLQQYTRFVNLSQLLKNYYELSQDPGLFKSYELMYKTALPTQKHDAFEDAYYTYLVFKKFREELNK